VTLCPLYFASQRIVRVAKALPFLVDFPSFTGDPNARGIFLSQCRMLGFLPCPLNHSGLFGILFLCDLSGSKAVCAVRLCTPSGLFPPVTSNVLMLFFSTQVAHEYTDFLSPLFSFFRWPGLDHLPWVTMPLLLLPLSLDLPTLLPSPPNSRRDGSRRHLLPLSSSVPQSPT